jgi:hypothetical protein
VSRRNLATDIEGIGHGVNEGGDGGMRGVTVEYN